MTVSEVLEVLRLHEANNRGDWTIFMASDPEGNSIKELDEISNGPSTITFWPA